MPRKCWPLLLCVVFWLTVPGLTFSQNVHESVLAASPSIQAGGLANPDIVLWLDVGIGVGQSDASTLRTSGSMHLSLPGRWVTSLRYARDLGGLPTFRADSIAVSSSENRTSNLVVLLGKNVLSPTNKTQLLISAGVSALWGKKVVGSRGERCDAWCVGIPVFEDVSGFGGSVEAGIYRPIVATLGVAFTMGADFNTIRTHRWWTVGVFIGFEDIRKTGPAR